MGLMGRIYSNTTLYISLKQARRGLWRCCVEDELTTGELAVGPSFLMISAWEATF